MKSVANMRSLKSIVIMALEDEKIPIFSINNFYQLSHPYMSNR